MTTSKSIIIIILIIVINFECNIEATSIVDYCHNYTRCFDEMMSEQEKCSAMSNNRQQQQQSMTDEYQKLRHLIAKRKEYFANCIMAEANKTKQKGSNCTSDNVTTTSTDNTTKKRTTMDKSCWKNIRIIRNRCTLIEQCCPFIQICQQKTESSDEAKAVNDQHAKVMKQLKGDTNTSSSQTLPANGARGGYRTKVLAERIFRKMTISNSTAFIKSNKQNITTKKPKPRLEPTTTTQSLMIMPVHRQLTNSTKLIKRRRNLKTTMRSRKIHLNNNSSKSTTTQTIRAPSQSSSTSRIDALEIINELRKISAKVGNDDDERAKVLNGAAELIAMVEIGGRNAKLPIGQSMKNVEKRTENGAEMISTNIPFDAYYRKQQTVFSRSIDDHANNVIGDYSELDTTTDYCPQYAHCLQELQSVSKKCSWNQPGAGGGNASRMVPGLPRRRDGACQRMLSVEYARLSALTQVQQAFMPECLQQSNNDEWMTNDEHQPEHSSCYDVVKPKLPEYDDDQQKCLHGVRILRNYCRSFRRCCPKADYCHQAELDSDDYKAVQLQRHDLMRKSASCQISANDRYRTLRLQMFNSRRVKSNRIVPDSRQPGDVDKIIKLLNDRKSASSPNKKVDENFSIESDSSQLPSVKLAPFVSGNNNKNNYHTAPIGPPIAKIPPLLA